MANLKTYLQSLVELAIHNTLPSSSQGVVEQSIPAESWTYITAPFDGFACFIGEDSNGLRGFRIISGKIELNVASVQTSGVGWASGWVPITKGKQVSFYINATESLTARLVPNIQSSL